MSKRIPAFLMALDILDYSFTKMVNGGCEIDQLRARVEFSLVMLGSVEDTTTKLVVVLGRLDSLRAFAKECNFGFYEKKLSELIEVFREDYLIAEAKEAEEVEKT